MKYFNHKFSFLPQPFFMLCFEGRQMNYLQKNSIKTATKNNFDCLEHLQQYFLHVWNGTAKIFSLYVVMQNSAWEMYVVQYGKLSVSLLKQFMLWFMHLLAKINFLCFLLLLLLFKMQGFPWVCSCIFYGEYRFFSENWELDKKFSNKKS